MSLIYRRVPSFGQLCAGRRPWGLGRQMSPWLEPWQPHTPLQFLDAMSDLWDEPLQAMDCETSAAKRDRARREAAGRDERAEPWQTRIKLPGMDPSSLEVKVKDQEVSLRSRVYEKKQLEDGVHEEVREIRRTVTVPSGADTNQLRVFLEGDGDLVLVAPAKVQEPVEVERREMTLAEKTEPTTWQKQVARATHGFQPGEVKVTVKDGQVEVSGEQEERGEDFVSRRQVFRSFPAPEGVTAEQVRAAVAGNTQPQQAVTSGEGDKMDTEQQK